MTALKPPPRQERDAGVTAPAWRAWLRRHLRGREGDAWVLLGVLVVGLLTASALTGVAGAMSAPSATPAAPTTPHPPGR